jgi:hypothetical protein
VIGRLAREGSLPNFGTWKAHYAMIVVIRRRHSGYAVAALSRHCQVSRPTNQLNYFAATLPELSPPRSCPDV